MIKVAHLVFGLIFVVIDTDQFMPQLNVFTLDSFIGSYNTFKYYSAIYSVYFFALSIRGGVNIFNSRFLILILVTIGFVAFNIIRIFIDGFILIPSKYSEVQNILLMALVAAGIASNSTSFLWLRPFLTGAIVSLLLRVAYHFLSNTQKVIGIQGVDVKSFYGTYGVHCTIGTLWAIFSIPPEWKSGRMKIVAFYALIAIFLLMVIASGFRRMPMVQIFFIPALAILIYNWRKNTIFAALPKLAALTVVIFITIGFVFTRFYGWESFQDRVLSIIYPSNETLSTASNECYVDDIYALIKILDENPLGVGYGNSYGVVRLIESFDLDGLLEAEVPMHIGFYALLARSGVAGLLMHISIVGVVVSTIRPGRKMLEFSDELLLCWCSAFLFFIFLFPLCAPPMQQVKLMVTYGILLGTAMRLASGEIISVSHPAPIAG